VGKGLMFQDGAPSCGKKTSTGFYSKSGFFVIFRGNLTALNYISLSFWPPEFQKRQFGFFCSKNLEGILYPISKE